MIIHVDWECIKQGTPDDPCYCPVALALIRQLNYVPGEIAVLIDEISIRGTRYTSSNLVKSFIQEYDNGKYVVPFKFELPL